MWHKRLISQIKICFIRSTDQRHHAQEVWLRHFSFSARTWTCRHTALRWRWRRPRTRKIKIKWNNIFGSSSREYLALFVLLLDLIREIRLQYNADKCRSYVDHVDARVSSIYCCYFFFHWLRSFLLPLSSVRTGSNRMVWHQNSIRHGMRMRKQRRRKWLRRWIVYVLGVFEWTAFLRFKTEKIVFFFFVASKMPFICIHILCAVGWCRWCNRLCITFQVKLWAKSNRKRILINFTWARVNFSCIAHLHLKSHIKLFHNWFLDFSSTMRSMRISFVQFLPSGFQNRC